MFTGSLVLALIGMVIQGLFIAVEHKEKYTAAVFLKGTASMMFVIIGATAARHVNPPMLGQLILLGLVFGAVGDVLLNLRFVFPQSGQKIFLAGIAAFLVGHILYLAAILPKCYDLAVCIIVGVVIAAGILTYIFKTMTVKPAFKIFGIFYIGAVVIMTSVAIGNVLGLKSLANMIYAVGAVAFTLSDIVLIFNTFGGNPKFSMRIANLSLYYVGQLLIAASLLFS